MQTGKGLELRTARHGAVVVHDLDNDRCRLEPGQARQVATRLGVTGTRQHATGLRHHGKDVPGLAQVVRAARSGATAVRTVCARS